MLQMILFLVSVLGAQMSFAQTVDVKDVNASGGETTTIEITKGKKAESGKPEGRCEPLFEIVKEEADIEGDVAAVESDAVANWKKACADWKKEVRADNKENKVIALNCGKRACTGEAGRKACTSKASFSVKTKLQ